MIKRWLSLWTLFRRRCLNVALLKCDGSLAQGPEEEKEVMSSHWGGCILSKRLTRHLLMRFLEAFASKFEASKIVMPTDRKFKFFITC